MKSSCFLFLQLYALAVIGQTLPAPDFPSAQHQALSAQSTYVNGLSTEQAEASRLHKIYQRWSYFWAGRLDHHPTTGLTSTTLLDAYQNWQAPTNDWDWDYAGPGSVPTQNNGRVECAATPSGTLCMQELLIGTPTSGIWRSSNSGNTWHNVTDDDFDLPGMGCQWLTYHPTNPNIVYAAISLSTAAEVGTIGLEHGYGLGLYASNDGGENWHNTSLHFDPTEKQLASRIHINPENPDQMYAAVNGQVYATQDAWESHTLVFDLLTQSFDHRRKTISDLGTSPGNFDALWVASSGVESWLWNDTPTVPNHYRWHSAELWHCSGVTAESEWELITSPLGPDYSLLSNSTQPAIIEIEFGGGVPTVAYKNFESNAEVWQLEDGQWQQRFTHSLDAVGGEYQFAFQMASDNADVAYLGQRRLYRADLTGVTSIPETLNGPHVDTRYLGTTALNANGQLQLLQGNDGGLAAIRDSAGILLWDNLNGTGLNIHQLFGLGLVSGDTTLVVTGSQDNSAFRNTETGWNKYLGGDRYDPVFHRNGSGIFPYNPAGIQTFSDLHAGTFTVSATPPTGSSFFNRPVAQDQDTTAYVGYSDMWSLKPFGQWVQKSNLGLGKIRAIAVSEDGNTAALAFEGPTWGGATGKLFVTSNLNTDIPTWTDITEGVSLSIGSMGINALAFAPYDPTRLFVGFERFDNGFDERRVLALSLDPSDGTLLGSSAIGQGLPNVPVNVLRFSPGPAGQLWLGNDLGVFLLGDNGWEPVNGSLPAAFVSDIEFDPANGKVWVATFGRGLWTAPLPCTTRSPISLHQDQTWNGDHFVDREVTVPEGITLTITGKAFFTQNAGITVLPGGKLDIDGGCLGTACDGFSWRGIEAHGQEDHPQHPAVQPRVRLSNGAQILQARVGVLMGAPGEADLEYGYGGGLLYTDRSIFRDCERGIVFAPYRWSYPSGSAKPNSSHIARTDFNWVGELPAFNPATHLYALSINRLTVAGCTFGSQLQAAEGTGIQSKNATLHITPSCEIASIGVCPSELPCTFSNLKRGLDARSWMDSETFVLENALFNACTYAIRTVGVMDATIIGNSFTLPDVETASVPPYGLHMLGCSRYQVEDNLLDAGETNAPCAGMIITSSEDDPNAIRNNTFSGLQWGIVCQGDNKDDSPNPDGYWDPASAYSGLQILCNAFAANQYDIVVSNAGQIAPWQGSSSASAPNGISPAGNAFLSTPCTDANALHVNPGSLGFHYFYPENLPDYLPAAACYSSSALPNGVDATDWNGCLTSAEVPDVLSGLSTAVNIGSELDEVMFDTRQLVDGGDTQTLLNLITNPSTETKEVLVAIKSHSPWISDPVLVAALERSGLSMVQRFTIALSNLPLSPTVWNALENAEWLDTVWMLNLTELQQLAQPNAFSKRKLELANLRAKRTSVLHACVQKMLTEPDSLSYESLLETSGQLQLPGDLRLAHALRSKQLGYNAPFPATYPDIADSFSALFQHSEGNAFEPSGNMDVTLELENWRGVAVKSGANLGVVEPFYPALPVLKSTNGEPSERTELTAFPNPGHGIWAVEVPATMASTHWKVYASDGRVVAEGLTPVEGMVQLDAQQWNAGIYLFTLFGSEIRSVRWIKN